MSDSYLLLTPILMLGVMLLVRFVGCDVILGLTPVVPHTQFVSGETLGRARNDYTGWVGMAIQVGAKDIKVLDLGRIVAPNSSQPHDVKIYDLANNMDVPGGIVAVSTINQADGQFAYVTLGSAITLSAGKTYYVVSHEVNGGDQFYDNDTILQTTDVAVVTSPVYRDDTGSYVLLGSAGNSYGPVSFRYDDSK